MMKEGPLEDKMQNGSSRSHNQIDIFPHLGKPIVSDIQNQIHILLLEV